MILQLQCVSKEENIMAGKKNNIKNITEDDVILFILKTHQGGRICYGK